MFVRKVKIINYRTVPVTSSSGMTRVRVRFGNNISTIPLHYTFTRIIIMSITSDRV